jgi:hypothetical protein
MISKYSFLTAASALVVGAALVLTGCSSKSSTGASSTPSSGSQAQGQGQGQGRPGGQGGFGGGGTAGEIAAVDGSTLQVQSSSSQTAVDVSSSTAITKTVDVALSAVKVGECITATTAPAQGTSGSSSSSSSSSSPVTSVAISQPTNGSCDGGFGGAGGQRPTDRPSNRPSGWPSGFPSGAPGGQGGQRGNFVLPTSGKVTAVSGSTLTVDALDFQTQKTSSKTVTVDSSTTYTEQQTGASSDLVVGQCVVARGKADDTGTVAATAITVSAPVNGSCDSGFGGRGGFGGGRGGTGTSGTGSSTGSGSING